MRKFLYGVTIVALVGVGLYAQGGAFIPSLDYTVPGLWTFTGTVPVISNLGGVLVGSTSTTTLTNKTLTAPTITAATMTGTSTIAAGMTLTSPAIVSPAITGTSTIANGMTITTPIISSITNTGTVTLPSSTGGIPTAYSCGASLAAAGTCANTSVGAAGKVYSGTFLLAASASAVVGLSPAFTSSTSYNCVANDITTRANPVQAIPVSGSAFTITNTTGATDLISVICAGS